MADATVVIAAWCAEATIERSVRSALAQRHVSVEVVVVDDASPDGTAAAVAEIADPRVRFRRLERNGGPGSARNAGFAMARGRWIAVLDADDVMEPERLATMLAAGEDDRADVVIDDLLAVGEDGARIGPVYGAYLASRRRLDLDEFMLSNRLFWRGPNLGYVKPVFRTAFLRENGLRYQASLRIGEDYVLLADCLAAGARTAIVPRPLYHYTRRQGSTSARLEMEHIERMQAADRAFGQRWHLDAKARTALARRSDAFKDAAAFTRAVAALKRRDPVSFCAAAFRRPGALALFRYPLTARLARLVGRGDVSGTMAGGPQRASER